LGDSNVSLEGIAEATAFRDSEGYAPGRGIRGETRRAQSLHYKTTRRATGVPPAGGNPGWVADADISNVLSSAQELDFSGVGVERL